MKDVIVRNEDVLQEFAYVYSLILIWAHTNTAIAKVNAEQLQMYWEIGGYIFVQSQTAQITSRQIVQTPSEQLQVLQIPAMLNDRVLVDFQSASWPNIASF